MYFGGRNQPTTDSTLNVPYGNVQHKQGLEKAAAGVIMAVVGLFLEPATPRGRDVSSSAITETPDPDRTWGGQRDASLLSGRGGGGSVWLPGLGGRTQPSLCSSASRMGVSLEMRATQRGPLLVLSTGDHAGSGAPPPTQPKRTKA